MLPEKVRNLGRNLYEYIKMFSLSAEDLRKSIVDCAGGPSSFNCELTRFRGHVVSCDPVYALSRSEIEQKIQETHRISKEELVKIERDYGSDAFKAHNDVWGLRRSAMNIFLDDFEKGKGEQRYVPAELPRLGFASGQFQLALCAHFLFSYTHLLTFEFHLDSIHEMARVADEARIYPVFGLDGKKSGYLEAIVDALSRDDFIVSLQTVDYELIKGSNQMLVVKSDKGPAEARAY